MTVSTKALIESALVPAAETLLYTASVAGGVKAIIDKMTLTNTTVGALTATVKLIPNGGSAAAGNTIISAQGLAAGQCYTCPEIVGHTLMPGDMISVLPSGVGIACRASGREVT